MIAKGRSLEQALIEDSLEIFHKILREIPQFWKKEELSIENNFREIAKMESDGNIEDGSVFIGNCSNFIKQDYGIFFKPNGKIEYAEYLMDCILHETDPDLVRTSNSYRDLTVNFDETRWIY